MPESVIVNQLCTTVVFHCQGAYALATMWRVYVQNNPTLGPMYAKIQSKPSWVWKIAIATVILIVVIPLGLLVVTAMLIGLMVFFLLGALATLLGSLKRIFRSEDTSMFNQTPNTDKDARINVRVIHHD
ncbi:MAG: hypothetical protein CMJ20_12470 [Phycisphaeraceae bacterium]|nr:hypothetical protein [Phycisphaeraceae bacterium]